MPAEIGAPANNPSPAMADGLTTTTGCSQQSDCGNGHMRSTLTADNSVGNPQRVAGSRC